MKAACPNCGAEIEFRYDDSFVRVCEHCRSAVLRTDRGLDTLGKFADLVPMDSPLKLFAGGQMGSQTFILVGVAQLRQQAGGLTQEWYAKFSGAWGWLAEAQGRYYLTFEAEGAQLPRLDTLYPGLKVQLPTMLGAMREFTVSEVSSATYLAANGELPFKLAPNTTYHYADLSDGQGNFATIDYGDASTDTPTLYTGQQLTLQELNISGGEIGPSSAPKVGATRLGCPNCNAPVDIFAAGQTQRAVCSHCNTLLDVQSGAAKVLAKLGKKAKPNIPLGTMGTFSEGKMRVIGYVQRSALLDGTWYPFYEYLLYEPSIGFRWLVQSDGHWSYVQPVDIGAIEYSGSSVKYDGVKFRLFQRSGLRVDEVLGEFYWQVSVGEQVAAEDYVAPPAMLSKEASGNEELWSLSTYMKPSEVQAAFGDRADVTIGGAIGVAPNQPDPTAGVSTPLTIAFVALLVLGIVFAAKAKGVERMQTAISIPAGVTPPAEGQPVDPNAPNIFFSEPFNLESDQNIELGFSASLDNNWAYVVASLVNVSSGDVVTVDASMEHYSGVEDGESWSEGKPYDTEVVGPMAAGQYVLRLETQQGGNVNTVPLNVRVRQDVFRGRYLGMALGILGIPFLIFGIWTYSHEKKRWENSTEDGGMPKTPMILLVMGIGGLLAGIFAILKAFGNSSDD